MPKKQQPPVNEKPNSKESTLGILTSERIEELFGLAAEGESQLQSSMPAKSKRQIKKDKSARARVIALESWAKRKAAIQVPVQNQEKVAQAVGPLPSPKAKSTGWHYPIISPLLVRLRSKKPSGKPPEVAVQDVPGNGHKPEIATTIVAETQVAVSPFKYEGWQPQEIPSNFGHMTPHWLWRRIHWEEQAKIARVKPTGLSPALKIGAAIVVLLLFLFVIFMFGVIIMGGGSK